MSPRSTSSRSANGSGSSSAWLQTSWRSPLPSRSVRNFSFPMSRFRTTRPATVTVSSALWSGGRSPYRSRRSAVAAGSSTPSASSSVSANARSPSRSSDARRALRTSSSREGPLVSAGSVIHVLLVDQSQTFEGQERLVVIDRAAVRDDHRRQPAGRDRGGATELAPDPVDDPVDLARRAEHEPGLDRLDRVLADHGCRGPHLDAGEPRRAPDQRLCGDLQTGRDDPAEELAVFRNDVEVRPRA